jgi:triacylglycerol lipase
VTTRHLVDPELLALVDSQPVEALTMDSLPDLRRLGAERLATLPKPAVAPQRLAAPGPAGAPEVPVLLYRPPRQRKDSAALLHIHGGGTISGSPELSAYASAAAALEFGIPVVSVYYRLAPETPFPGAHEDCYAALVWLVAQAGALGIDARRIAVSGDSAGGGLAAALTLMARDRGEYAIAAQFLTYPMLDHRTGSSDDPYRNPETGEFAWTRQRNRFAWAALRGAYAMDDGRIGWFSPARAADLSGLPPAWIGVGTLDLMYDESVAYAERLRAAGVATRLEIYPGATHAFNAAPEASVTRRYRADLAAAFGAFAGAA